MLCARCKQPIPCKSCGSTEYSQYEDIDDSCICDRFRPDKCEHCEKIPIYINKDIMWYIKSTIEVIQILVFLACLIGFISSWFVLIWNKEIANLMIGFSIPIGLVNALFIATSDSRWRESYEDFSIEDYIREKKHGK